MKDKDGNEIKEYKTMTKRQFDKVCADFGIHDVEIVAFPTGGWDGQVWSPKGKTFYASGCHCCVTYTYTGTKSDIYVALALDIMGGLDDCTDPTCEYCTDEEDEAK